VKPFECFDIGELMPKGKSKRLVRLSDLTPAQRRLVLALVDAAEKAKTQR
jgi:hypothetical protein